MRKRVWGLYTWGDNSWWMYGNKRAKFNSAQEAFQELQKLLGRSSGEGWSTGIRPFYIVTKPPRVGGMDPKKVQAVVDAAQTLTQNGTMRGVPYKNDVELLCDAVRALNGK